jgi:hypothetical protein
MFGWQRQAYMDLVHAVHAPIMLVGLVALLGAWHDPVRMAVMSAFGVVTVFLLRKLLEHRRRGHRAPRRHHATACTRAFESVSLMPLQWHSCANRSGGAPPPAPVFNASVRQSRRHAPQALLASRGVFFVPIGRQFPFPQSPFSTGGSRCPLVK